MKNKGEVLIILLGYLTVLTVLFYLIFLVYTKLSGGAQDGSGPIPAVSDQVAQKGRLVMTQEELDELIEQAKETALSEARAENEESLTQMGAMSKAEVLDGIRSGLEAGDSTMVEILRPYYPDDILVVSGGKYHFVPIDRTLKQNDYQTNNLSILDNGEYQYLENGEVVSFKGIDVSSHQGRIDWDLVARDGVEFAIIRAGYRGYGSAGRLVPDDWFRANMEGALAAGIHVGVYFFSQAINDEEALEEANLVLEQLAPYGIKCPVVYDVEKTADKSGRMNQLSLEDRTNLALLFCETVKNAGYKPMIYHNMEMAALMIDLESLEEYDKWFAYYNEDLYYPYAYSVWQYSDKGRVNGINTNVDLNISFNAFWEQ